jgi:hypothetical protein
MILTLLFVFFLVLESLILPALIGAQPFLITLLFIIALLVYSQNSKVSLLQAFIFLLASEIFLALRLDSLIVPFAITAIIYLWINRFLEIGTGLRESSSLIGILGGIIVLSVLVSIYSYIFLFFESSFSFIDAWNNYLFFVRLSVFQTLVWALFFVVLFKYLLKGITAKRF